MPPPRGREGGREPLCNVVSGGEGGSRPTCLSVPPVRRRAVGRPRPACARPSQECGRRPIRRQQHAGCPAGTGRPGRVRQTRDISDWVSQTDRERERGGSQRGRVAQSHAPLCKYQMHARLVRRFSLNGIWINIIAASDRFFSLSFF